ncbi:MAG: hypothetical protein HYV07_25845 [Deltaproteobacteria bacterium]|nr:hypothetical protein [Deltaproteobacteria bacterium]
MSLMDLMSAQRLETWAELAMFLFLGVYVTVAWRTCSGGSRRELEEARLLPFSDERAREPK